MHVQDRQASRILQHLPPTTLRNSGDLRMQKIQFRIRIHPDFPPANRIALLVCHIVRKRHEFVNSFSQLKLVLCFTMYAYIAIYIFFYATSVMGQGSSRYSILATTRIPNREASRAR